MVPGQASTIFGFARAIVRRKSDAKRRSCVDGPNAIDCLPLGIVLVYWLWSRRPLGDPVGSFRNELRVLGSATPARVAPANRLCANPPVFVSSAQKSVWIRENRSIGPSALAAAAHSHTCQEVRRRRRDVDFRPGRGRFLSLFAALLTGSAVVVFLQVLVDVALVSYIYLLLARTDRWPKQNHLPPVTRGRDRSFVSRRCRPPAWPGPTTYGPILVERGLGRAQLRGFRQLRQFGRFSGQLSSAGLGGASPTGPSPTGPSPTGPSPTVAASVAGANAIGLPDNAPSEAAQSRLADMQSARELALAACRKATRFASGAIRAVHTRDASRWELLFGQSEQSLREAQAVLGPFPAVYYAGFLARR